MPKQVSQVKGQGSTEYLMILATVLVVAAAVVYFVTSTGRYPAASVTAMSPPGENTIRINVETGSIAAGDWQWSIRDNQNRYYDKSADSWISSEVWNNGGEKLESAHVELGEFSSGVYYVSLKHKPSGHLYFSDKTVQV